MNKYVCIVYITIKHTFHNYKILRSWNLNTTKPLIL